MTDTNDMRRRHEFVMQEHHRWMRQNTTRTALLVGLLAFVFLLSLMIILNPAMFGISALEFPPHMGVMLLLFVTVSVLFVVEQWLALASRKRIIEMSMRMTQLAFDLGVLIGRGAANSLGKSPRSTTQS